MKLQKTISVALSLVLSAAVLTGCGTKNAEDEGKINVSVGCWPDETQKSSLEKREKMRADFMEKNPDINIIPDTYNYETKTFTMKAAAGQLPNLIRPWYTEINMLIKQGYVADITEQLKKAGYIDEINPELLKMVSDDEGRVYAIPLNAYAQGLYINKKLFREAGLVDENGKVKIPNTYDEVAEYSKIISEKTGKAGLLLPTTNNCGGWHFLNIAWSYGVEFAKQDEDGKWKACFDTKEAIEALQYVKDLKWKYNGIGEQSVINQDDLYKYFGTNQAAMMFADPPCSKLVTQYGMNKDDIYVARMPEGPKGRFSQMGGNLWVFGSQSTPEQIEAGIKWLGYTGVTPFSDDETLANYRRSLEDSIEKNEIVLPKVAFKIWNDNEKTEKIDQIRKEYSNVAYEDYEMYFGFEDVTIRPEPAACAQELYSILDGCIQEVITNKDADVEELIKTANEDYQLNHLNKM